MRGVGTTKKEKETPEEQWQSLERMFTIQRKSLAETRNYLLDNVQSIAEENPASQWCVILVCMSMSFVVLLLNHECCSLFMRYSTGMNPCRDGDKKRLSELASTGN
jgi:hypothetical protein